MGTPTRKPRRAIALLTSFAVLLATFALSSVDAAALPPQPTTAIPPIIGNSADGIFRDVPLEYYAAIDAFENNAILEVLGDHDLPLADYDTVKAWGRDAVRTQEFLDLLTIITKPPAERTLNEALVYEYYQQEYKGQQIAQAQAAVDEYVSWSGLSEATINDDPIPIVEDTAGNVVAGYCPFRPPAALMSGSGVFGGVYNPTMLPQCNGQPIPGCDALATGCPVPWPTVDQFQQWGRYRSQQAMFEDPVFANIAMEVSTGVGLAATMVATGVATALARSYASPVAAGATGLFTKVFPHAARATFRAGAQIATEAAKTATRLSAGIIRAGSVAFVVGTILTALVTIGLEAWTIYEHAQIPIALTKTLTDAKNATPDLASLLAKEGGPSVLLTTFLTTTATDVDYDCQLPTDENSYSFFPCANAPAPAAPTPTDDVFYVTTEENGVTTGAIQPTIYTVNPADSRDGVNAHELTRLSGKGWFVPTKYDGTKPENLTAPTTPGKTLQTLRLYYRDWDGKGKVAQRFVDEDGVPKFIVSSLEDVDVGVCATAPTDGVPSTCKTDTIRYVEPDGTKASAKLVAHNAVGPTVDAQVPEKAVAGVPVTFSATAKPTFGPAPFTYTWTLPGAVLSGASVTAAISRAGPVDVRLDVRDAAGNTTTRHFPVLVAQNTDVDVLTWPAGTATYGSTVQVWARISPRTSEGVQCTWNQTTGEIGCVAPTGMVQYLLDGNPIGDPVPVTTDTSEPCAVGWCFTFGDNRVNGTPITLPPLTVSPGSHPELTAVYYGDDKFVGGTDTSNALGVVAATPDVALTSETTFPDPAQPASFTVSVLPKPGTTGVPTGTVRILEATSLTPIGGAVPIDSTGTATVSLVNLRFINSVVFQYNGDANFAPTQSVPYDLQFRLPSSATVTPAASTVFTGARVDLTITILDAQGEAVPGASVALSPGGATGTTGDDGTATLTVTSTEPGTVDYAVAASGIGDLGSATVTYVAPPSPTTNVLYPHVGEGQSIRGGSYLIAGASLDTTRVDFEISGGGLAETVAVASHFSLYGWATLWKAAALPEGTYTLRSVAYDAAGISGRSEPVSIRIDRTPPTTSVALPQDGATISGSAVLAAAAADNLRMARVDFQASGGALDNAVVGTAVRTIYGWFAVWDTTLAPNGIYALQSRAVDEAGNVRHSAPVDVTVAN